MPRLLLPILFLALCLSPLSAQEDLTLDSAFFHQQKDLYQRWLEYEDLDEALCVEAILVEPEQLTLYLGFHTTDEDTVYQTWKQLKTVFEEKNPITLEQHLFYKLVQLMEIREDQARVALYSSYDVVHVPDPCFIRGIYFEDGQVQVFKHNCKSEIRDIEVQLPDLNNKSQVIETEFRSSSRRKEVFDKIYEYAAKRFGAATCEGQPGRVFLREKDQVLRFEVKDLCKEVITESRASLICQWLPIDCKERREWLIFTITYFETSMGFKLSCQIDGKVGSGYFGTVSRGAFYDMEIDFDPYLKDYADSFKLELQGLF
ncbi:MAG: hypothetical protein IPL49_19500 [Saprospirales bacterium]|nr:hypothetical protein [Saprospirales bacterium]